MRPAEADRRATSFQLHWTNYDYSSAGELAEKRAYGIPGVHTPQAPTPSAPGLDLKDPASWAAYVQANLDNPHFNPLGIDSQGSAGAPSLTDCIRTVYERDDMGRLMRIVTPDGITHYQYDELGRLIQVRNDRSRTTFAYDPLGQLIEETSVIEGEAFTSRHRYDSLGNRIATILPDGRTLNELAYGSGHVHQINLDGEVIADIERDRLHREIRRSQGPLASHYGHDASGRLILQRALAGNVEAPPAVWEALGGPRGLNNIAGNPSGFEAPGQNAAQAPVTPHIQRQYQYDRNGQLKSLIDARKGATQYGYDRLGRLTVAQQREGRETFAFDPAHNLVPNKGPDATGSASAAPAAGNGAPKLVLKLVNNLLEEWDNARYQHDRWGNRIETVRADGSVQRLRWNCQQQLIEAVEERSGKLVSQACYRYDGLGRRIGKSVVRYDKGGKPHSESMRFVWDGNRLLLEQTDKSQSLYVYEPDSFVPLARIDSELDWPDQEPSADESWIENNTLDVQEAKALLNQRPEQILKALQQSAYAQRQANPLAYLTAGGMPLAEALDRPKPKLENSRTYWYHCDHLGTPQELTDAQGNIVWAGSYKAWGKVRKVQRFESRIVGNTVQHIAVDDEPVAQNIRFQGQYEDEETGLHYNRFRYYDPDAARYISQDPIGLMGGRNLYTYVHNPITWIDPLGLAPRRPIDCAKSKELYDKYKAEIENGISIHDYKDKGHVGAKPQIPGGVSGAIVHTKQTGDLVGGSDHIEKGQGILRMFKNALKSVKNAYDLTQCQKDDLAALAKPYEDQLQAALAMPQQVPIKKI